MTDHFQGGRVLQILSRNLPMRKTSTPPFVPGTHLKSSAFADIMATSTSQSNEMYPRPPSDQGSPASLSYSPSGSLPYPGEMLGHRRSFSESRNYIPMISGDSRPGSYAYSSREHAVGGGYQEIPQEDRYRQEAGSEGESSYLDSVRRKAHREKYAERQEYRSLGSREMYSPSHEENASLHRRVHSGRDFVSTPSSETQWDEPGSPLKSPSEFIRDLAQVYQPGPQSHVAESQDHRHLSPSGGISDAFVTHRSLGHRRAVSDVPSRSFLQSRYTPKPQEDYRHHQRSQSATDYSQNTRQREQQEESDSDILGKIIYACEAMKRVAQSKAQNISRNHLRYSTIHLSDVYTSVYETYQRLHGVETVSPQEVCVLMPLILIVEVKSCANWKA